jgi:hypothetical protein
VYGERQFLRLCWRTWIMGTQPQQREQWTNINTDRKRLSHTEDSSEKSQNYCSTAEKRSEYSSWRHVSIKTTPRELHKSDIYSRAAIVKLGLLKVMLRLCHDRKILTSGNWKRARDMVRWVVLHAVPYIRKSIHLENTQRSLQSGMPGSNSETRGKFYDDLDSNIVIFCWSHYYRSWPNYWKGVRGQVG